MYLSKVAIWNFRIFGTLESDGKVDPGIKIYFNSGLNVLIGENDAGKTAIVDAIRIVLGTQSKDYYHVEETDFHLNGSSRSNYFKIECIFSGFTTEEAAPFIEWIDLENIDGKPSYTLRLSYTAKIVSNRIVRELRAGSDPEGTALPTTAQDLLRITYLKPLRDAESDLIPSRRSRLAQILKAHPAFKRDSESDKHPLELVAAEANSKIESHFKTGGCPKAAGLLCSINSYLKNFFPPGSSLNSSIRISGSELNDILQRLSLLYNGEPTGLGSLNLLYIAAELILMQAVDQIGLKLTIIEELEAHLHPQAQLRLINYLQDQRFGQLILTTHSTTLASSIKLENLIICKDGKVFPMGSNHTSLDKRNYDFLERFLDATKANLFFAKGVILVEGDAENLLLPTIARLLDRSLHKYGVSIVNVGSTAFLHYAKIFDRKDGISMGIKVSLVTDLDVKPLELQSSKSVLEIDKEKQERLQKLEKDYTFGDVKAFVSPNWTLEYELSLSKLKIIFLQALLISEKMQNATTGTPKSEKIDEANSKVFELYKEWKKRYSSEMRINEIIAQRIYADIMLKQSEPGKKKISKAIAAQEFARHLDGLFIKRNETFAKIMKSPSIKYIRDAIEYVTEPI